VMASLRKSSPKLGFIASVWYRGENCGNDKRSASPSYSSFLSKERNAVPHGGD